VRRRKRRLGDDARRGWCTGSSSCADDTTTTLPHSVRARLPPAAARDVAADSAHVGRAKNRPSAATTSATRPRATRSGSVSRHRQNLLLCRDTERRSCSNPPRLPALDRLCKPWPAKILSAPELLHTARLGPRSVNNWPSVGRSCWPTVGRTRWPPTQTYGTDATHGPVRAPYS